MLPPSEDLGAFRDEVRLWLGVAFPASLKGMSALVGIDSPPCDRDDLRAWTRAVAERRWGAPVWPAAYGGGGLTPAQAAVLRDEMAKVGAWNPMAGVGLMIFGPALLEFGSEAQKQRHIPPITRREVRWCQGFSEPGAGSDLASLQTRCEDRGDHWLVNGSKVWTSAAQYADWCFCLVRTDPTRKHDGISFLLIDMRSPGVEARPIKLIDGESPFCETFFTDVRVPKDNLVGAPGAGWTIAKRLLQFERGGLSSGDGAADRKGTSLAALAKASRGVDASGRIEDHDLRSRMTVYDMDARAFALTTARAAAEAKAAKGPSVTASIMKNASSALIQGRQELVIEMLGHQGLGWDGEGYGEDELRHVRSWLMGKAASIYGGSHEIQNNIIAKRILGLPDAVGQG